MPFRTVETLEAWISEFEEQHFAGASVIRVIPPNADGGVETGLVGMRLPNSPTEIYIEPPARAGEQWMITFEPREDYVRLGASDVQILAVEMSKLAGLCAFLQRKSDGTLKNSRGG